MKLVIYILATAVALIAGTSLVHQQQHAQTLRQQELTLSGAMLEDQVLNKVEDRIARFTEGLIPIGETRRERLAQLATERQTTLQSALGWGQTTGWALGIAAVSALAFTGTGRRRALTGTAPSPAPPSSPGAWASCSPS
jgi:hypothetical protein